MSGMLKLTRFVVAVVCKCKKCMSIMWTSARPTAPAWALVVKLSSGVFLL